MAYKVTKAGHHHFQSNMDDAFKGKLTADYLKEISAEEKAGHLAVIGGEYEEVSGVAAIKEMATFISDWGSRVTKTQDARREEVLAAINAGGDIKAIWKASKVSWATIIAWAKPGTEASPKPMRVTKKTMDKILRAQEAAKKEAEEAKKAGKPVDAEELVF